MMDVSFDSDGLITLKNGDGGDCGAESGRYYSGLKIRERLGIDNSEWPKNTAEDFENVWARLVLANETQTLRYNKPPYNSLRDVSRDQTMPMFIALYLWGYQSVVVGLIANLDKTAIFEHTGFFPNGDPVGLMDWGIMDRMTDKEQTNIFGDLHLVFAVLLQCMIGLYHDAVANDLNLKLYLDFANLVKSTRLSRLAAKLYQWFRPWGVQYPWDRYYRPETQNNPLNELWRPINEARLYLPRVERFKTDG